MDLRQSQLKLLLRRKRNSMRKLKRKRTMGTPELNPSISSHVDCPPELLTPQVYQRTNPSTLRNVIRTLEEILLTMPSNTAMDEDQTRRRSKESFAMHRGDLSNLSPSSRPRPVEVPPYNPMYEQSHGVPLVRNIDDVFVALWLADVWALVAVILSSSANPGNVHHQFRPT